MRPAIMLATAFVAVPSPALACMENSVPYAIIFGTSPAELPGTFRVGLTVLRRIPESYETRVRVNEGPAELVGLEMTLVPENFGSCATLGRDEGYAVVRKVVENREERLEGLSYERSWFDWFISLFGVLPYYSAGSHEPTLHLS